MLTEQAHHLSACDFCAKVKPGSYYFDQEVFHVVFLCDRCATTLFDQLGPARGFEPDYQAIKEGKASVSAG